MSFFFFSPSLSVCLSLFLSLSLRGCTENRVAEKEHHVVISFQNNTIDDTLYVYHAYETFIIVLEGCISVLIRPDLKG